MRRRASRVNAVLAACSVALATVAFAACGDEEEQTLAYTVTDQGKGTVIEGPTSADTGLAEITFRNEGEGESDLQLIRVEGNHSAEEVVEGLEMATKGKPFPDWFFAGGGIGVTGPGESQTVTQVLESGTYYAFDTEGSQGPPDPKSLSTLKVGGEESSDEIQADATVSAIEYGFEAEEIPSGKVEIEFENAGVQPHHLIASPLVDDATAEEVEEFFKSEKGKPPLREKGSVSTAVLEGGEGQAVTLDLKPGRYAFYCFIADREGGPPHVFKGMVDEFDVE